jgi:1-aminocyclopropane-1-carboxylate deaminase
MAGLVNSTLNQQFVLGFNALNNPEVSKTIKAFTQKENWSVFSNYTFGGYAKVSEELIVFMNNFYQQYQIPLDPIYTGKMLFGIFDLIKSKQWSWGKNILVIHSGGLQGIEPMNLQLKKKRLPLLHYGE